MHASGMGRVGFDSPIPGPGRTARFMATVLLMDALSGLSFGERPSKLGRVGERVGFAGSIFLGISCEFQGLYSGMAGDI